MCAWHSLALLNAIKFSLTCGTWGLSALAWKGGSAPQNLPTRPTHYYFSSCNKKPHCSVESPDLKFGVNETHTQCKRDPHMGDGAEGPYRSGTSARTRNSVQITQDSHAAELQDFPSIIPSSHFCYVFLNFLPPFQSRDHLKQILFWCGSWSIAQPKV